MRIGILGRLIGCLAVVALAGCGGGQEESSTEGTSQSPSEAHESAIAFPDTTAEAVWSFLSEENYQETWSLWPGKGELYEGTEPHGMLLTTYVNPVAEEALTAGAGVLPDKSILVKENYTPDSELAAVTVMFKSHGYNPDHNDWFWLKRLADGTVETSGRSEGCISCHGGNAGNDYIMTTSLQ